MADVSDDEETMPPAALRRDGFLKRAIRNGTWTPLDQRLERRERRAKLHAGFACSEGG